MAPVIGSTVSSTPSEAVSVTTPLVTETLTDAGWPWWKWVLAGVGVYGGLALIGWATKSEGGEEKKKPAAGRSGAVPRGGHAHQHGAERSGSAPGGGSAGMSKAALERINAQIQLLAEREEYDAAEKLITSIMEQLEQVLQATPNMDILMDYLAFQKRLADIYRLSGKYDKAEERLVDLYNTFTQFQAPAAELALVKHELSQLAEEQKDYKKAERLAKEALQLQEQAEGVGYVNNWPLIYKLAVFRKHDSDWVGAEALFRKAVKLLEGAPPSAREQASSLASQVKLEVIEMLVEQKKYAEADEYFQEVAKDSLASPLRKQNAHTQFQDIARVYFRVGQFARAEQWLNEALSQEELSPNARYDLKNDLANLYVETGREEEGNALYTELKNAADATPFTESRYFKTVKFTGENDRYRLVLSVTPLPDYDSLPNTTYLEAIFESVEGLEDVVITQTLSEAILKKKEIELSSKKLDSFSTQPRLVSVTIWWDDTKSKKLGTHRQLFKNKPLLPFFNFNASEESSSSSASSTSTQKEAEEKGKAAEEETTSKKEETKEETKDEEPQEKKSEEKKEETQEGKPEEKEEEKKEDKKEEEKAEEQKETEEETVAKFEATLEAALEDPLVEESLKEVIEEVLEEQKKEEKEVVLESTPQPSTSTPSFIIEDGDEEEEEENF